MIRVPVSRPSLSYHEREYINAALDCNQLTCGPLVAEFERQLAEMHGVEFCVVASSGTTALHLALLAAGIGPGDEVLVPDLTFVATANAVRYCGAEPVLCDIDSDTWCIDIVDAWHKVSTRTRAIVPVHLYGAPYSFEALHAFSFANDIKIVEDAAEGFGGFHVRGRYAGRRFGSISDLAVFSFYGNKVITVAEGGAILTPDPALYSRLVHLRGQAMVPGRRFFHDEVGFNYRLSDLHAAIGLGQLRHLDDMLAERRAIIERYARNLGDLIGDAPPCAAPGAAPWLFTAELPAHVDRNKLAAHLEERGIETRPAFVPLHRMPMYERAEDRFYPVASRIGDRGLSFPTWVGLSLATVDEICDITIHWSAKEERSSHVGASA